jgi:hypothetical protein
MRSVWKRNSVMRNFAREFSFSGSAEAVSALLLLTAIVMAFFV